MTEDFYRKYGLWILCLFAAFLPVLAIGAVGTLQQGAGDVRTWLPQGFEETRDYDWFLEHFGTEEMVALSWPGATLEDPRLAQLADLLEPYAIADPPATAGAGTHPTYFREVHTGPGLIDELTSPPLNLRYEEAFARLQGSFIGRDGQMSALVVSLHGLGAAHRHDVIDLLRATAEQAGIPPEDLHMGGPTVDSVTIDIESRQARNLLSLLSVLVGAVLAWICLRRLQLVVIVFASALLSTGIAVSVMHFTGGQMDLVTVMMPPLVYVLTISGAIHLINYHIDVLAEHGSREAVVRTVRIGWLPCLLTAITTAVGLGSLATSEVLPVKRFGTYASIGVLLAVPVLLLFLPAALQYWPVRARPGSRHPEFPLPAGHDAHWTHGPVNFICRHHRATTVALVALILLVGSGLFRIRTSVRLLELFSPQARIIHDYTWLEEHLGPLVPIELVLRFPADERARLVDRMELVQTLHDRLQTFPHVGGILSAATFSPPADRVRGLFGRRLFEERLRNNRSRFIEAAYVREARDEELWRISARVDATSPIDYGDFVNLLRREIQPLLDEWSGAHGEDVRVLFTGMVPLVYKAQRALLGDLVTSFVAAFLLIGVMMMALLRSIRGGLISMLPNAFPAVIVFGFLGWWGQPINIGQMMTASLALGIAVDDTIHLLNWFRRDIKAGLGHMDAIRSSFEHCTGAMLQTSLITGFGVLTFTLSAFVPTYSFAMMLFVLLFLALLGELILLPAILTGRWGRFFTR